MKKIIPFSGNFPLSSAIVHDARYSVEISGQIGINPKTKQLEEGIKNQTSRALEMIKSLLEQVGWNLHNVVKARVYLSDMKNYGSFNMVYEKYFSPDFPTRVVIGVNELPAGALVEIECSAVGDEITTD